MVSIFKEFHLDLLLLNLVVCEIGENEAVACLGPVCLWRLNLPLWPLLHCGRLSRLSHNSLGGPIVLLRWRAFPNLWSPAAKG